MFGTIAYTWLLTPTQARRRLAQIEAAGTRWARLEALVRERGWRQRLATALELSLDGPHTRARYAAEAGVAAVTASQDLRRLTDAGLLIARGGGRAVRYESSDALRAAVAGE